MAENALAYPGDVNALAGGAAGAQSSNALARPSPLSWEGMRDNLSNLYHSLAEGGLYFTPAAIPLSARDAYNAATTQPEESKLSPLNVQGNRTPDLSTLQGWKSGLSDLYQSGGDTGLALTGMFAGPRAKTADLSKMNRAAAMESAGHSPDSIWKETGWFKGADGKWKFEIPDNEARIKEVPPLYEGKLPEDGPKWLRSGEMGNFLSHPEAYKAYPSLEKGNVQITPNSDPRGPLGSYYAGSNWHGFNLSPRAVGNPSVSLHEMQHAVQREEAFARGGNSGQFTPGEIAAERNRIASIPENKDWASVGITPGDLSDRDAAHLLYHRLAGETEARNVQARMNMTPEERMLTPPWKTQDVPNEQQIVRFGNEGVQESRSYTPPTPWVGYRPVHEAAANSLAEAQAARNAQKPFDYSPHFQQMEGANAAARADPASIAAETEARRAHMQRMRDWLNGPDTHTARVEAMDAARRAEIQKWLKDQGIK